jgi:hypothetical protein
MIGEVSPAVVQKFVLIFVSKIMVYEPGRMFKRRDSVFFFWENYSKVPT